MPIEEDNTEKFFNDVSNQVSSNLKKATAMVEHDAKRMFDTPAGVTTRPHVISGTLVRSITHEFVSKHTAIVGSNVEYASHLELGTVKMSARPFLRPALAKNRKAIKKLLK